MKVLALDYDGVLVDSRKETFAVAYNIYQKLYGFKNLRNGLLSYKNFDRIDNELADVEREFTKLRSFCIITCNLFSVMSSLDRRMHIEDKQSFEEYRKTVQETINFRKKFHDERERLQKENFKEFLKLTPPHASVIKDAKKLMPLFDEVFIFTANRADLVRNVLKEYGLDLPLRNILDAEFMEKLGRKNKKVMVEHILEMTKAKPEELIFVEDKLESLENVLGIGIKPFLVDWGFDTKESKEMAKSKGIEVLNKMNFYNEITGYLNKLN